MIIQIQSMLFFYFLYFFNNLITFLDQLDFFLWRSQIEIITETAKTDSSCTKLELTP